MSDESQFRTRASLLEQLRTNPGDGQSWAAFVARYTPVLRGWCRERGLQSADADELVQRVLLRLLVKIRSFVYDPARTFRGWLRTVARNAWADMSEDYRRQGIAAGDTPTARLLQSVEARQGFEERIEGEFDRELFDEAVRRVRLRVEPHTWDAFRLIALEGRPGAEAARELNLRVATAFKARSKVQALLRDEIATLEHAADRSGA